MRKKENIYAQNKVEKQRKIAVLITKKKSKTIVCEKLLLLRALRVRARCAVHGKKFVWKNFLEDDLSDNAVDDLTRLFVSYYVIC